MVWTHSKDGVERKSKLVLEKADLEQNGKNMWKDLHTREEESY
jgi:hypothetical protein